jgi:hypothetical protein
MERGGRHMPPRAPAGARDRVRNRDYVHEPGVHPQTPFAPGLRGYNPGGYPLWAEYPVEEGLAGRSTRGPRTILPGYLATLPRGHGRSQLGGVSPDMARVINVDQSAGADQRLYGMMQYLMAAYAQQQAPEKPDPRDVVELQDALDAVIQLAAVIDEETQAGRIPVVRGQHAAAMLMLVREYIQPLPRGLDADGVTDNLTTDLGAIVMALREARQATGYKG